MALNPQGYFNCLKSYLHHDDYGVQQSITGAVVLKEKIHKAQGERPKEFKVTLATEGDLIVIKLDGRKDRLFHFLDDTAKPWSKRCDFVILICESQNCTHIVWNSNQRISLQTFLINWRPAWHGAKHYMQPSKLIQVRKCN